MRSLQSDDQEVGVEFQLVKNEPKYYEFIRTLRNHDQVQVGFLEKVHITPEQQQRYMAQYADHYYLALVDAQPAGYIGEIDGDIRLATHPNFQRKGVAEFMLRQFLQLHPQSTARVKVDNPASLALFRKLGFREAYITFYPPDPGPQ